MTIMRHDVAETLAFECHREKGRFGNLQVAVLSMSETLMPVLMT
jgi:hypothetical protein